MSIQQRIKGIGYTEAALLVAQKGLDSGLFPMLSEYPEAAQPGPIDYAQEPWRSLARELGGIASSQLRQLIIERNNYLALQALAPAVQKLQAYKQLPSDFKSSVLDYVGAVGYARALMRNSQMLYARKRPDPEAQGFIAIAEGLPRVRELYASIWAEAQRIPWPEQREPGEFRLGELTTLQAPVERGYRAVAYYMARLGLYDFLQQHIPGMKPTASLSPEEWWLATGFGPGLPLDHPAYFQFVEGEIIAVAILFPEAIELQPTRPGKGAGILLKIKQLDQLAQTSSALSLAKYALQNSLTYYVRKTTAQIGYLELDPTKPRPHPAFSVNIEALIKEAPPEIPLEPSVEPPVEPPVEPGPGPEIPQALWPGAPWLLWGAIGLAALGGGFLLWRGARK